MIPRMAAGRCIQTERPPTSFAPRLGRLHNPLSAAGHNRESEPGNRRAHFQGQFVMPIVRFDSRRTEDDHARTNEMKSAISRRKSRMTRSNVQNSANRERGLPEIFHQRAPAE